VIDCSAVENDSHFRSAVRKGVGDLNSGSSLGRHLDIADGALK